MSIKDVVTSTTVMRLRISHLIRERVIKTPSDQPCRDQSNPPCRDQIVAHNNVAIKTPIFFKDTVQSQVFTPPRDFPHIRCTLPSDLHLSSFVAKITPKIAKLTQHTRLLLTLGVRPLKKEPIPSVRTMSRMMVIPETLALKLAFWIRVLTTSRGAATVMEATAPVIEATKSGGRER
jgi:hypothetical protein